MILNTGDVPNLYAADEKAEIIEKMQNAARVEVGGRQVLGNWSCEGELSQLSPLSLCHKQQTFISKINMKLVFLLFFLICMMYYQAS